MNDLWKWPPEEKQCGKRMMEILDLPYTIKVYKGFAPLKVRSAKARRRKALRWTRFYMHYYFDFESNPGSLVTGRRETKPQFQELPRHELQVQ